MRNAQWRMIDTLQHTSQTDINGYIPSYEHAPDVRSAVLGFVLRRLRGGKKLSRPRNEGVDTLRGFACVMLIFYHIIGPAWSGLMIEDGFWRNTNEVLSYVRMPMFTILSGVVYAWRPFVPGETRMTDYIRGKGRRLLLPLLFVGTPYAVLLHVFQGTEFNWFLLHLQPVSYFWFLEALFLVFLITAGLERLGIFADPKKYLGVLLGAFTLFVLTFQALFDDVKVIADTFFLLPYFLLGAGLHRFDVRLSSSIPRWVAAPVFATMVGGFVFYRWGTSTLWTDVDGILFGAGTCCGLYLLRPKIGWLANIGTYSYSIYLFHGFFTSFANTIVEAIGNLDPLVYVVIGLPINLAGGIAMEKILDRYAYTRLLFLGRRPVSTSPASTPPRSSLTINLDEAESAPAAAPGGDREMVPGGNRS